ncbi:ovarian-specific serine/threonine-protein kinase Lok [Bicyclus anynana]|uniref:Ovarian-specific serine/threonine-protein kinase Lok n=1 Tax=Bicyclus anynana TaxID=110368 RepID=A0A6J1MZR3_BICAN|nr:ovarian-specific serine/threonine-protein kinase Lok [Bicyclus anynana]
MAIKPMCDDVVPEHNSDDSDTENTLTQNSQHVWSPPIEFTFATPNINWGRLYSIAGKHFWKNSEYPKYYDLVQPEFSLGRALICTFVTKKNLIKENTVKCVSKKHFVIKRDLRKPLTPAIITDLSYNGTYINYVKLGHGCSRVLNDKDVISVTHVFCKTFKYKDLWKK